MDPNIAAMVHGLIAGTQQMPSSFAQRSPYWQNIIALTRRIYPNFDAATYPARAALIKSAVAAMTRLEAEAWAGKAIRFNAIVPQTLPVGGEPVLRSEPDMAALALYLASARGKNLSGLLFEAEAAQAAT